MLENTSSLVEKILAKDERTRNSDTWLCFRVYEEIAKKYGKRIFIPFELFEKFPSFETITRVRRKLQNDEGKYLPSEETQQMRKDRQADMMNWAREK
jgi:hypothetical protein